MIQNFKKMLNISYLGVYVFIKGTKKKNQEEEFIQKLIKINYSMY